MWKTHKEDVLAVGLLFGYSQDNIMWLVEARAQLESRCFGEVAGLWEKAQMCLEVQVGFIAEPELLVTCELWRIGHGEDKKATSRVSAWASDTAGCDCSKSFP